MNGTVSRLLATSRRLFAERGYHGTSIRLITRRARTNLGAVTYHFGSKEALYHAMLTQIAEPLVEAVEAAAAAPGGVPQRIEAIIRAYFEYFERCPELPAILVHELALGRRLPAPVRQALGRLVPTLVATVEEGQRSGCIAPGPPIPYVLSIIAQPFYFSTVRRAVADLLGPDAERPDFRAHLISHAVAFARRGLAPPSGEQTP